MPACAGTDLVSPVGNWVTTWTWGAGSCGSTGTTTDTTTVTKGTSGYVLSESNPNATISGTITCTVDSCVLSATQVQSDTSNGTNYTTLNPPITVGNGPVGIAITPRVDPSPGLLALLPGLHLDPAHYHAVLDQIMMLAADFHAGRSLCADLAGLKAFLLAHSSLISPGGG